MSDEKFCTAINCLDGRTQLPVINYLQRQFGAPHVDLVTEAGPNGILARGDDEPKVAGIFSRVLISVEKHRSVGLAVAGHNDCAGNPGDREKQEADTRAAVKRVRERFPGLPVIGLYVNGEGLVEELSV